MILAVLVLLSQAVIVDRIAVVVSNRPIKTSDIDRDIRMTQLLNEEPLDFSPAARRRAADRLIDQMIIRREIEVAGYSAADPKEAARLLVEVKRQRPNLSADLKRYGVTEDQLLRQLRWQLTVLQFIEQRFRPGVLVTDDEIRQHSGGRRLPPAQRREIENRIAAERVNEQFDAWLKQAREQVNPEFMTGAVP